MNSTHKGWCHDPDKAFDAHCSNLGCEDWCEDNSNCPIQGKGKKMFILVNENKLTSRMVHEFSVIVEISEDGKTFKVLGHANFKESVGQEYHISMLKHILTAGSK